MEIMPRAQRVSLYSKQWCKPIIAREIEIQIAKLRNTHFYLRDGVHPRKFDLEVMTRTCTNILEGDRAYLLKLFDSSR